MCIHAGTHLTVPLGKLQRNKKQIWVTVMAVMGAVSISGAFAFMKRKFADYMFLKSAFVFFDFYEPRIYFFLDYLAMMILCAFAGYWIIKGLNALDSTKKGH